MNRLHHKWSHMNTKRKINIKINTNSNNSEMVAFTLECTSFSLAGSHKRHGSKQRTAHNHI